MVDLDGLFQSTQSPPDDVFFVDQVAERYGLTIRQAGNRIKSLRDNGLVETVGSWARRGKSMAGYRLKGKV